MLHQLTHYTTALVFLSAISVVYQNVVTPWMEPPQVDAIATSVPRLVRDDHLLADLFVEGSWQRGQCKQLQTSDGMLLFQDWKQIDGDQWKLWPVTVVIGRGMSGVKDRVPVVIDAPQGAEIKFTKSLDVMSGGAPPIERGRMIGPVHIYRQDSPQQARSLDLRTANVGIDNRKIWTTETIEMKFGEAQLLGRDLTLHLSGPTGASGGSPTVLDRMELIYLDKLVMPMRKGGLWNPTGDQALEDPAMISIQCGGRVEYDFGIDQLLMQESVSLIHQAPGLPEDRFDCESLELTLNDPANDLIERESPMDWILEIVATGSPALAKLPSFNAELAADRIEFDAAGGHVQASGRRGIRVVRGGITARLARLVYQFDPKRPETLGTIEAPGPGIVHVDDPAIAIRKAQWRERFTLRPLELVTADQMDCDVHLVIDGDFHAWLADGGEFRADSINGTLTPEEKPRSGSRKTLVPDRFDISGNVRIDTTAISAETQLLTLFFVAEADPMPDRAKPDESAGDSPLRQWVAQPQPEGAMVAPVARPRPTIVGDAIIAKLRRNEAGLSAKDLTVNGNVEIHHHLNAGGQSLPARLTGQQLRLIDGGGEDVLQLGSGPESPARFELGDGFFIGPQIQIRPSDNIIWINAAGEFQMPTAALPTGLAGEANQNIQWTKPPHCRWHGEMTFDGRTAVLSDGVDVTASLLNGREPWELRMTGDRLQVDLSENVQVRDIKAMRSATIERVAMLQADNRPVMVQALRRAADGVLEAKHLIYATQLDFTPADGGKIVGAGPGWYRAWTLAQSGGLFADSSEPAAATTATLVDAADRPLTGIHLIFNDSMQADMTGRHLDFLRGVRVGVRRVSNWDEAFDARSMDAISIGESTLDCDRLRFNVEPEYGSSPRIAGTKTPWEMEAISGVVFRTRSERGLLEGTASRAAYASSKDLFTVDGAPNRAAIFRHTLPDGSKGHEGAVRTMSVRPGTMKIENMVLERINIATPPGTTNR